MQCRITCELKLPQLTVKDILQLTPGSVLPTEWKTNKDLPLLVNRELLGWVEFESTGDKIAVRVTEFAWEHEA